jgi:hypothetical protein
LGEEKYTKSFGRQRRRKESLERPRRKWEVNIKMITLKWALKKYNEGCGLD